MWDFKNTSEEKKAELVILLQACIYGLLPILINYSTKTIEPIFFAGICSLLSTIPLLILLLTKGNWKELFNLKALPYILGVTLFNVIAANIFIFEGTSLTSGVNTAILLQAEIPFTFLICGFLFKEKINRKRIAGGLLALLGATLVLYNGGIDINKGDLMIIAGTALYPFGNHFAKQALKEISPTTILFIRSLLGGSVLIVVSLMFEKKIEKPIEMIQSHWIEILTTSWIIWTLTKLMAYWALKRLEVIKTIVIGSTSPAFSLLYALLLLNEVPDRYQISGLIILMISTFVITKKTSKKIAVENI